MNWFLLMLVLAQGPVDEVRQMESQLKGKLAQVRTLVSDGKVRYDAAGQLIGKWRPGLWTLHSHVEITKIELKGDILKVDANRILLNYRQGSDKFSPMRTPGDLEIEIQTSRNADGSLDLQREWNKAFLTSTEAYPVGTQPYWKPFLGCLLEAKTEECAGYQKKSVDVNTVNVNDILQRREVSPGVFGVGGAVTQPRIRSRKEPVYTQVALRARIEGTVLLEAIVKKDGGIEIRRVVRPLGFGLEEGAAEALSKWTFYPATLDGQPVDVLLDIEVNFAFRR